jgi:D-sedoheptulose 7-phosphate isomerase
MDTGCTEALCLLREVAKQGSSAVASHIANDLCNTSRIRALTLNDHAMLTCFSNDYGYADAYATHISRLARPHDLLVAISSSGASQNILKAIAKMRILGGRVLTLTGFSSDNPVRSLGDLNVWLDSCEYGVVETGHLLLMHYLADRLGAEGFVHHGK